MISEVEHLFHVPFIHTEDCVYVFFEKCLFRSFARFLIGLIISVGVDLYISKDICTSTASFATLSWQVAKLTHQSVDRSTLSPPVLVCYSSGAAAPTSLPFYLSVNCIGRENRK